MKEVTLKIPEEKLGIFMELVHQLGFEVAGEVNIPEAHKTIVRKRIKAAKPENMMPWEVARKQFTFKGKS